MGWTFTHKPKGSIKKFFEKEFNSDTCKVVDCKVKNFVAYIAYQTPKAIIALVCLLKYQRNDYFNFGYKDMDETMGPYYYDCPVSILNQLTPIGSELANKWRNKCRINRT